MKISTKLYTGFSLVVALTAALGFYISYVNNKFLIKDSGRDAVFQSKEIIKRFDQAIHDKIMEVGAATKRSWVNSIVADSNSLFEKLENIDGYLAEMESQRNAVSGENANALQQELMSNSLANELRDEFITFYEAKHGQRVISNLLVTNKYGASIAQTDEIDHFRHDTKKWWQETRRLGMETGQSEYEKGSIWAAFRINDAKGDFIGVLKTVIDIKAQIRRIELASMQYQTTQTTMLTMDGKIIYRTRPYRFMEDFSTWQYFDRLQGNENSFVGVSKGNKRKLYSFSRSKDHNRHYGFGWILLLESDLDDILVPAHALRNHIAIVSLLLILLGTTIAFFISGYITRSLTKINEGASRIGAGDLNYLLKMESKDEFNQLACSFNTMVRNLQKITASRNELNHEIKERKQAENQIKGALEEKEVLFKEIHHRVKNNMQIIQSLLSLQSNEIKNPEHKKPLIDSNNRIKSMALIHEILYRSDNMAILDINLYFNEIVQHLFKIYKESGCKVDFNLDIDSVGMGMDLCIACGLIMNELVSNALKYAFVSSSKGELAISLKTISTDEALLIVKDNGHGLPADLDLNISDSLGLKIVKILVEGQLKGYMKVKNHNGASFEIYFPFAKG